jgi:phosphopantothenoylcysteine decarboxylase/phosphopantothenate--cysteine ligase
MKQTILIGVSSGIAAYKVLDLVRSLRKRYNVIVMMTRHAKRMISPAEFEKASGNKVASELFPRGFDYKKVLKERRVKHISLADKAAVVCVVPATANVIAKVAGGVADDLLTTTILATKASLLFCPSMNVNMWKNDFTKGSVKKLRQKGAMILEPESGKLACGYEGKGRLPAIKRIEREIIKLAEKRRELAGKKAIVTAGGTEEEIDNVRVITNKSSGRMGIRIAEELAKRGAKVTLIRGRTEIEPCLRMKEIKARGVKDMLKAVKKAVRKNDIIVHAAAVSDFKARKKKGKIKSDKKVVLELAPNVKVIDSIKKANKRIFLAGFKAEHDVSDRELKKRAGALLKKANADMVVGNDISGHVLGSDRNEVIIIDKKGKAIKIKRAEKAIIAEKIVDEIRDRL